MLRWCEEHERDKRATAGRTFGTPAYTSLPLGWFMMTPGLGLAELFAMSSYMKTTMFSSFNPPFFRI
jgi:hypothetical protein